MSAPGFTNYDIEYVIKFGGSLLSDSECVRTLIQLLVRAVQSGSRLLVIPGGGPTDLTIERMNAQHSFDITTCHYACALAQDQTGILLADRAFSEDARKCRTLEEVLVALDDEKLPILLPSAIMFSLDPVLHTWDITSDAIAAWFSWIVSAENLIILTNVDGIFQPGHISESSHLIRTVSARDARKLGHTAIDAATSGFLQEKNINCWILNGGFPKRTEELLAGKEPLGTFVIGE